MPTIPVGLAYIDSTEVLRIETYNSASDALTRIDELELQNFTILSNANGVVEANH